MNRVKEVRLSRNIKQTDLAHMLGISVSHLNRIEANTKNLPLKLAYRIAEVLDCTLDEIFLD